MIHLPTSYFYILNQIKEFLKNNFPFSTDEYFYSQCFFSIFLFFFFWKSCFSNGQKEIITIEELFILCQEGEELFILCQEGFLYICFRHFWKTHEVIRIPNVL